MIEHKNTLKKNKHSNDLLQSDFNLHGIESFIINVIELIPDDRQRREREKELILLSNPDELYNINYLRVRPKNSDIVPIGTPRPKIEITW